MNLRVGNQRLWATVLIVGLLLAVLPATRASATLEGCAATINPHSATAGTDGSFTVNLVNQASSSIEWVDIIAPGGGVFTVESGSANHWTANTTSNDVTYTNWALTPGRNQNFTVQAFPNTGSGPVNWTVQASDDPGGANAITCSGNTSVDVAGTPIAISNVQASNVTSDSATITWDTNVPGDSQVNYGTDSSYGSSSPDDPTMVTSHSVTLTGLSSDTDYHFQATSTAVDSSSDQSSDDTFLTATAGTTGGGGGGGGSGGQSNQAPLSSHGIAILKTPIEATPPTISITSQVPRVQKVEPTVEGMAGDDIAVARVEFSTDGGTNWLPVQQATGLGSQHVSFSFTPIHLDDGTYNLVVRAVNTSGLIAKTAPITIVIDRSNPLIGPNVVSLGPQILGPDKTGTITTVSGVDQKIILSAIGGPNQIMLTASSLAHSGNTQVFNLTKAQDTGLWSGVISFSGSGNYSLVASAVDGAGVTTSRTLNNFYVTPPASTVDARTGKPVNATVNVYYLQPDTNSWVLWDGASYGQSNPYNTGRHGQFGLLLPAGKYYMTARAPGYRTVTSSIFTTTRTQPVSTRLRLTHVRQLRLGPIHIDLALPSIAAQAVNVGGNAPVAGNGRTTGTSLVGQTAPNFMLNDTNGGSLNPTDLLGKPTVLVFGTTWSPTMSEQINVLSQLQADTDLNIVPVAVQQGAAVTQAYTTITGLNLNWLVDPSSALTVPYDIQSLPTSYFINREGVIQQVVFGVLTRQQMLTILSSLN
jgi:peroxiredoxin